MIEIVFHGRGGQGAVTAVQILAEAAFLEGYHAQAFPRFGIERRGAPVAAYARIGTEPIQIRGQIVQTDFSIVGDMMAIAPMILFKSMKENGTIIINTVRSREHLQGYGRSWERPDLKFFTIGATEISRKVYGEKSIPITSVAMLGAFCAASNLVQLHSITAALAHFFPPVLLKKNTEAARLAFEEVRGT